MRKPRRNTKLWFYLYKSGVLDSLDEQAIKTKAQEYWRMYDRERKQKKRAMKREYTVTFRQDEIKALKFVAHTVGMSIPEYIRQLTRTNVLDMPFVPHSFTIKHIEQLLIHYKNKINDIAKKDTKNFLGMNKNYDLLATTLTELQTKIAESFKETTTVQEIIKVTIQNNPQFVETLQSILKAHGY